MRVLQPLTKLAVAALVVASVTLVILSRPASTQANRQRYLPITFTQEGWSNQGQGIVYSSWQYAFRNFSFYGHVRRNWLYIGCRRTMSVEGSRAALGTLMKFLPQTSAPRGLSVDQDYIIPISLTDAGSLAGEVVALTMNVAFNDTRMMPRTPGYDLEKFRVRSGLMRGKTVGQVLDIADRILGGDPPTRYGIPNYQAINDVVHAINANYEFIDYNTYIDRGFLIPNRPFGLSAPAHDPHVP